MPVTELRYKICYPAHRITTCYSYAICSAEGTQVCLWKHLHLHNIYCLISPLYLRWFGTHSGPVGWGTALQAWARGGAVGWGTALQAWCLRAQSEFFIDIILPAALRPWGWLSLYQKWVPGIFPGGGEVKVASV